MSLELRKNRKCTTFLVDQFLVDQFPAPTSAESAAMWLHLLCNCAAPPPPEVSSSTASRGLARACVAQQVRATRATLVSNASIACTTFLADQFPRSWSISFPSNPFQPTPMTYCGLQNS